MGNTALTQYLNKLSPLQNYSKRFMKQIKEGMANEFKQLFLAQQEKNNIDFHSMVDEKGNNLMHQAVKYNQMEIVKMLVSWGKVSIEDQNEDGDTALMLAALMGHLDMVVLLSRQAHADINAKENTGHTPFMAAATNRQKEVVDYFLQRNDVDFKATNVLGQTVIHRCAYYGELAMIKFIIKKKGMSLSQKDYNMNRPIHLAAEKCNIRTIRYLIRKKGEKILHKTNSQQQSALDILQKQLNLFVSQEIEQSQIIKYLNDKHQPPEQLKQLLEKRSQKDSLPQSEQQAQEFVLDDSQQVKKRHSILENLNEENENQYSVFSPQFLEQVHIKSIQHNNNIQQEQPCIENESHNSESQLINRLYGEEERMEKEQGAISSSRIGFSIKDDYNKFKKHNQVFLEQQLNTIFEIQ